MSLEATRWATSSSPRSKGAARALLGVLADMASDRQGHTCWPKVETLAQRLNCSVRSVQRYLTQLDAVGDIIVRVNAGRGNRNEYSFPALSGSVKGDNPVTFYGPEKVTDSARKGDSFGTEKVTDLARKGDNPVTPIKQPILNLQSNNQSKSSSNIDEDDLAAPFRANLARIANRTLTDAERNVINAAAGNVEERRMLGEALSRLGARWPSIVKRSDVSGWLTTTLAGLSDEDAPRATTTEELRRRYAPDEALPTFDALRLEHAIKPEPLPAHSQLWHDTLAELKRELPLNTFQGWFADTTAVEGTDNALVVTSPRWGWEMPIRVQRVCERTLRSIAGRHIALQIVKQEEKTVVEALAPAFAEDWQRRTNVRGPLDKRYNVSDSTYIRTAGVG